MKLLNLDDNSLYYEYLYKDIYTEILTKAYNASYLTKPFNDNIKSEKRFLKLCFSKKARKLTLYKILKDCNLLDAKLITKFGLNEKDSLIKILFEQVSNNFNILKRLNKYLIKNFKKNNKEIDKHLMLANLIYLVELHDTSDNLFISILQELSIIKHFGYDKFFYFLLIMQHEAAFYLNSSNGKPEYIISSFEHCLKFIKTYINSEGIKEVLKIIDKDFLKLSFSCLIDEYIYQLNINKNNYDFLDELKEVTYLIATHIDTYDFLDETNKKCLAEFSYSTNLYFLKYCESLTGKEKDEYISNMVQKTLTDEAIII